MRRSLALALLCRSSSALAPAPLLVATTADAASRTLHDALVARGGWRPVDGEDPALLERPAPGEGGGRGGARGGAAPLAHLWLLDGGLTRADGVDAAFAARTGRPPPSEVVFLSRHASASGRPTLCVHCIGNPGAVSYTHLTLPTICSV